MQQFLGPRGPGFKSPRPDEKGQFLGFGNATARGLCAFICTRSTKIGQLRTVFARNEIALGQEPSAGIGKSLRPVEKGQFFIDACPGTKRFLGSQCAPPTKQESMVEAAMPLRCRGFRTPDCGASCSLDFCSPEIFGENHEFDFRHAHSYIAAVP